MSIGTRSSDPIIVRSPTRIDLAGGTLDCWPINAILSPVTTINLAIDIYTQAQLSPRDDQVIKIQSLDLNREYEFANLDDFLQSDKEDLAFYQEHIAFWAPPKGFELKTHSESPVGGGLGGSSSLSVSIFKAFNQWQEAEVDSVTGIRLCAGIEAKILQTPTGTQDYFPPYFGGLNFIDYLAGEFTNDVAEGSSLPFAQNILLFYTGRSHHSGINNWQVLKKFIEGDSVTTQALLKIKEISHEMREVLLQQEFDEIPGLINQEFQARIQLAEAFGSPEIDDISQIAKSNGALATKICGAGGGGCVFHWVEPKDREAVKKACVAAGYQHLDVQFV